MWRNPNRIFRHLGTFLLRHIIPEFPFFNIRDAHSIPPKAYIGSAFSPLASVASGADMETPAARQIVPKIAEALRQPLRVGRHMCPVLGDTNPSFVKLLTIAS